MKSDYFGKTLVQIVANLAILEYCRKMATFDKIIVLVLYLWIVAILDKCCILGILAIFSHT